ncbi:hypothetical protein [Mycolicibacterium sp. CBMA 361]|uniref:hypothetical protein n=1 Tax=Mycolicibacterium sp. CBMA 361 TaxID=2606610 RepID=UPI0012DD938C|nr:hypothetical protein [Mycolicibacterium sp. CBMA 361]
MPQSTTQNTPLYDAGYEIRRAVLGDAFVDATAAQPGDVHEAFQRYIIEAT